MLFLLAILIVSTYFLLQAQYYGPFPYYHYMADGLSDERHMELMVQGWLIVLGLVVIWGLVLVVMFKSWT